MKINYINLFLSPEGLKVKEETCDCTKTASGYRIAKASNFGGKTTLLKFGEVLKVDSLLRKDIISPIQCYTWFINDADKEEAKEKLFAYIHKRVTQTKTEATLMHETLKAYYQSDNHALQVNDLLS